MKYINPKVNPSGAFPPVQSTPAPGLLAISDALALQVMQARGFVELNVDDGQVQAVSVLQEKLDRWLADNAPAPTPAEQREEAYDTRAVIAWDGELLTVTAAAQLWQYYAAEGNEKATALQELIREAKAAIRAEFPDEEDAE